MMMMDTCSLPLFAQLWSVTKKHRCFVATVAIVCSVEVSYCCVYEAYKYPVR